MEGDICPDGPRVASVQGCPSQATHPCDAVSLHGLVPPARPEAPPRANFRARDRTRFTSACFHGSPPQDSTDEDARPHPDLGGDLHRRLFTSASSRGPAPSSAAARLPWRRGPLLLSRRLPRTAIAPSIPHASSIYLRLLPAPAAAFRREVGCDSHSSPSAVLPTKRRRCNQSLDRCQAAPSDSPLARIAFDLPPPASSARPPPSAARLGASPLEPSRSSSGQTAPTQPVPGPLLERALPRIPTRIQLQRRGPPRASGGKAS